MFWILKSLRAQDQYSTFLKALTKILAAVLHSSSDLVPVHTTFPEEKIKAVAFGWVILIVQAAKRLGLYSQFLQF